MTDINTPSPIETSAPAESIQRGPFTRAVHAGARRDNPYHSLIQPIVQTATFTFEDTAALKAFMQAQLLGTETGRTEYARYGSPTIAAVEARLAALEGAERALLFSSGMAAITTVLLTLLSSGSHLVMTDDCYRRTRQFSLSFLKRLGITCSLVPSGDFAALEAAIRPGQTRLLVSESPSNPYLRCLDLERFVDIARRNRVKTLVDATFATPLNLRPLDYGVDLVVHSATKYLAGHNDLLAGVLAGGAGLLSGFQAALGVLGAVPDAETATRLDRGLKTLALRLAQQNQSGQAVAEFLQGHPKIERVWYPGLASHPDHVHAARQMDGYGGVVSFCVKGDLEAGCRLVDAAQIPQIAASLGGVESLIEQPALMSYYELSTEERLEQGIYDSLVRLSLGIEQTDDLIADLDQALGHV